MAMSSRVFQGLIYKSIPQCNEVENVHDVTGQALLTVILRYLHKAKQEELHFACSPETFAKLKARLVLLANNKLSHYLNWLKFDNAHFAEFFQKLEESLPFKLANSLITQISEAKRYKTYDEALFNKICLEVIDNYIADFDEFFVIKKDLIAGADLYDFKVRNADYDEYKQKLLAKLPEIKHAVLSYLGTTQFAEVHFGGQKPPEGPGTFRFIVDTIIPLTPNAMLNIRFRLEKFRFENCFKVMLNQLNFGMSPSHKFVHNKDPRFMESKKLYDKMQRDAADFTLDVDAEFGKIEFWNARQSVFKALENKCIKRPATFYNDFLFEFYLHLIRYPKLEIKIYERLEYWLKHVDEEFDIDIASNMENFIFKVKHAALNEDDYLSLQQIINSHYLALFQNDVVNNANEFFADEDDEKKSPTAARPVLFIPHDFRFSTPPLSPQIMFEGEIPGTLTLAEIHFLNNQFSHVGRYQEVFSRYSRCPLAEVGDKDKLQANNTFTGSVNDATTIEEIAALVLIAKPYIDRHTTEPLFDSYTETWKNALSIARTKALNLLTAEIATQDAALSVKRLELALKKPFLTEHRNLFGLFFIANWGNASTHNQLLQLLENAKAAMNRQSLGMSA